MLWDNAAPLSRFLLRSPVHIGHFAARPLQHRAPPRPWRGASQRCALEPGA